MLGRVRLAAAALIVLAMIATPTAAVAKSRVTPYELMKVQLHSGKTIAARWNPCQSAITYRVNFSGLPKAKRAGMLKTVKTSFAKLGQATGMTYSYRGQTTFVPQQGNLTEQPAEIVVAAVSKSRTDFPMSDNSLGYGGVLWSTWYGKPGEDAAVMRGYVISSEGHPEAQGRLGVRSASEQRDPARTRARERSRARREPPVADVPTLTSTSPSGYAAGDLAGLAKVGERAGCIAVPGSLSVRDLR